VRPASRALWAVRALEALAAGRSTRALGGTIKTVGRTAGRASQALPGLLILYASATLLHFVHNAEFLTQYPNLPASLSRTDVYVAWLCLTALGVLGYVLYVRDRRGIGLSVLALYASLGFGGFLHYTRASMAHHSAMMNVTIWSEAAAATLLLINVVALGCSRARSVPPDYRNERTRDTSSTQ
jgi:hypothetical protein